MATEPLLQAGRDGALAARADASSLSAFRQEQLAQVQRARILAGAIHAVGERDASSVVIAEIVQRSGVSRRTFYELFADRDECLVAAFDDALAVAAARVLPALESQRTWLARLRAGVVALTSFLEEEPQLGRLLVCESLSGGRALADWRARVVSQLVAFVDEGRDNGQRGQQVTAMQADGSVGGALAVLQNLLLRGEVASFTALSGSLVAMIALPYIGQAAARRELDRPVPARPVSVSAHQQFMSVAPLKEAGMRLTYRTMRVLLAIADRPGASNREVGELAEIGDQGQASKLLRRLQRAGVVSNYGIAPGQGTPNVWQLTEAGRQLAENIRAHSEVPGAAESADGAGTAIRRSELQAARRGRGHKSRRGK